MGKNRFPSEKDDSKGIEKIDVTIAYDLLHAKKKKISCLCFET